MKLGEIQTIVRANVDNASADVDQCIIDAINFLSSIFPLKKIDDTDTTTADQSYIDEPTGFIKLNRLTIDGVEILELIDLDHLQSAEDNELTRWYSYNGKIQLTEAMTASGDEIKTWFDALYKIPEAAVDTDVPDELLGLVYVGATWRYYGIMVSKVIANRQDYPDVNPDEIREIRDQWGKDFNNLLQKLRNIKNE